MVARAVGFEARPEITIAAGPDRAAWDAFVLRQAAATGYHEWAWRPVFERSFGHRCVYLMARRDQRVEGILPLVEMRSRLFGRLMVSLPFVNYGGVLADSEPVVRALVDAAADIARRQRTRHVELRHTARRLTDLPCKQHKVAMHLDLRPGMWEQLDRKVRNQIRKAEKSDLTADSGGVERLPEFYTVFAQNMRDLGTPVYSVRFFQEVLRAFPDRTRIHVVRLKGRAVAGGLTFRTGKGIEVPWASSVREFNSLCPNHLLYWKVIETAVAEGCDRLDFGRSTPNEGTYKFKEQWGARPVPLHWEYCLLGEGGVPDQSPKNPKFRLAIEGWKRMPLWLANAVGPHIVRSIP
jgi:FemAB-related protein (PEP-CTERM system-associated)